MDDKKGEMSKAEATFYALPRIPVPQLEEYEEFKTWLQCVEAWSETSEIPKGKQGYILACEIPISSKKYGPTLREDLYREVSPKSLIGNNKGVEEIIKFLKPVFMSTMKTIYLQHTKRWFESKEEETKIW